MTVVDEHCGQPRAESIIRECTFADCEAIAAIYNAYVRSGGSTMDLQIKTAEDFRRKLASFSSRETILVLEEEEIVGWSTIHAYSERAGYLATCETSVYIRQDCLGRGLGTQLKKATINRCRDLGYHHLVAKVLSTNQVSIQYNQNLGYEIVGKQRHVGYANGAWQDVVIMQLILEDVPPFLPNRV